MAFRHTAKQVEACRVISDHDFTLLVGGAGSGKTFIAVRAIILRALKQPNSRHLLARQRFAHAKASLWYETIPEVFSICFPELLYKVNKSDWYITLPNGATLWLAGIDDKKRLEKILGRSLSTIYINEASQVNDDGFQMLRTRLRQKNEEIKLKFILDCNPPTKSHFTYKYFVLKVDDKKIPLKNPERFGVIFMNPRDNEENLPESYIADLESLPGKYKKRFFDGDFTDETEGALFKQSWIDTNRSTYKTVDEFLKQNKFIKFAVVAVDPATRKNEEADETGIVGVISTRMQKDQYDHFHVIKDISGHYSPSDWAKSAINLANEINADAIVIETNQGGDMCTNTLRVAGWRGKIVDVHAKRGKVLRADPVAALYEQGFIHHLNTLDLAELEEQQTSYVEALADESPDRLDALVYAILWLAEKSPHISAFGKIQAQDFRNEARKRGWQ